MEDVGPANGEVCVDHLHPTPVVHAFLSRELEYLEAYLLEQQPYTYTPRGYIFQAVDV